MQDEGSLLVPSIVNKVVPGVHTPITPKEMPVVLSHFFNATTTTAILAEYAQDQFHNESTRLAVILRDYFFLCASRLVFYKASGYRL